MLYSVKVMQPGGSETVVAIVADDEAAAERRAREALSNPGPAAVSVQSWPSGLFIAQHTDDVAAGGE
jgi:hypothetical protein